MSRVIHATQPAKASPTSGVGRKASAAAQAARKSSQREEAAAKREGTDRTPGEYANDFTPKNQPLAINAGDYVFSMAYKALHLLDSAQIPLERILEIHQVFITPMVGWQKTPLTMPRK